MKIFEGFNDWSLGKNYGNDVSNMAEIMLKEFGCSLDHAKRQFNYGLDHAELPFNIIQYLKYHYHNFYQDSSNTAWIMLKDSLNIT